MPLSHRILCLVLLTCTTFAQSVVGASGDPDLSFGGGDGIVPMQSGDVVRRSVLQVDGKVVVVGTVGSEYHAPVFIARYDALGNLDTDFNTTGRLVTGIDSLFSTVRVAVQPDGKTLVAAGGKLSRFLPHGAIDASFNGTGEVTYDFSAAGIQVQEDGRIVMAGVGGAGKTIVVHRYLPSGGLDTDFNGTGRSEVALNSYESVRCESVVLQPDGKILIGGHVVVDPDAVYLLMLVRFRSDGRLDSSLDGDGKVFTDVDKAENDGDKQLSFPEGRAIAVQPDGKIVAVGRCWSFHFRGGANDALLVVRYRADGTLDTDFNGTGVVTLGAGSVLGGAVSTDYVATSITVQLDGKVVVAGYVKSDAGAAAALVLRYQADGTPDPTFGGDGQVVSNLGSDHRAVSVAVQQDDKIVVTSNQAILRYLGDRGTVPVTLSASDVTRASAVLRGTLNPNDVFPASAVFEWGTSPSALTNITPPVPVPAGFDPVAVQATITGLAAGKVYYYRLRGDHPPYASQRGVVLNFATISNFPPGIISRAASGLSPTEATLNASINANSLPTSAYFEWGPATSYGNQTPVVEVGSGAVPAPLSATLTGLTTDQVYHFRAVATSESGTSYGPDRTFIPSAGAPQPQDDVVLIDGVATIRVLDNDFDPNGDELSLMGLDPEVAPHSGTAQTVGNLIFYTPVDGMLQDELGYLVQDATGKQAKARVRAYRLSEIRGQYFATISETPGTGRLNLEITSSGAFSLLLTWLGKDYAVKGRFDGDRSFVTAIPRKGEEPNALLLLELRFDPVTGQIAAQLTDSVRGGPFAFDVPRGGDADEAVDAVRGQLYTTTIDVPDSVIALPEGAVPAALNPFADKFRGSGFASVKIAKNRSARFVGQMPDTAKFSAGSPVSRRTYALYSALYQAKTGALGSVSGRATLQSNFELRGTSLTWQREADDRDEIFNGAFNTPAFLNGDRYTPPTRGQLMQIGLELLSGAFANAKLNMTLGGLAPDLQQALKFIPGSVRVVGENPSGVKLRISPTTGTFSGSFLHTVSQETTKFSGIFITSPFQIREGRGSFRGVGAGGKVRIAKP